MDKKSTYGEYLSSLALNMFQYEDPEIMYGDYIHRYFNQTLIQEYVNNLAPENAIIMIGSIGLPPKNITTLLFDKAENKTESWYGTKFIIQNLTKEYKKSLNVFNQNEHFQLRTKNIFITAESQIKTCLDENVKLKINFFQEEDCKTEMMSNLPLLYYDSPNIKIWHKIDSNFLVPKQNFYLNFVFPNLRTNASDFLTVYIFYNYLKYTLETSLAEAGDAGNEIQFDFTEK